MMRFFAAILFAITLTGSSSLFGQFHVTSTNGNYSISVNFSQPTITKWNVQSSGCNYSITMKYVITVSGTGIPSNNMYDLRGVVVGTQELSFDLPKGSTSSTGYVTTAQSWFNGNPSTMTTANLIKKIKMVFQWNEIPYQEVTLNINPLPIELIAFDAVANGNQVDLAWSTASERDNDYFTIERTKDGINFEKVADVKAGGNSSSVQSYSYTDENPVSGTSYYRLKQTDYNGQFELFDVKSVEVAKTGALSNVYPNPAVDSRVHVSISESGSVVMNLYNMNGQLVSSQSIDGALRNATETIELPTEGNMFFVELIQNNEVIGRHKVVTAK